MRFITYNDCEKQHFAQMAEVQRVRGKMHTNTAGTDLAGNKVDFNLIPYDAAEVIAVLAFVITTFGIALAL
jgi:hypothetical protein